MGDKPSTVSIVSTVVGTVVTFLLAINTYKVSQVETEMKRVQSDREMNFRIYQSIVDSLESGNVQRMRAVRALVEELATDKVKKGFLNALDMGEVNVFESQESTKTLARASQPTEKNTWQDWDFDIFWCSKSAARAESQAKLLVEALVNSGAKGRIRDRILPESIRTSAEYKTDNFYEIRYEAGEADQANALKALAEKTLNVNNVELKLITPKTKTAWYISMFICP